MPIYALEGVAPEFPSDGRYWVAPTAVVIGRVKLMKNASVWFGAVLRGDNDLITVGENSNVQDNSIVHTDPGQPAQVGANVTIGHNVILHSTTVGDNSLIGMGATLLNRSRIGKNCIVGANTLIPEGKEFADGSLIVGSPGRFVRPLTEGELLGLQASADVYVANYKRFRDRLVQLT
ncbi:MAG: gamma carbonic anhydrase family protein [Alphaproteobacteria bacterium]|nr:gamma carbonic anhydrase family protein [Alphaproteobacteria bacterium]MDE2110673.1 gamma carbonic anhydrase family protein [Alphaproteobacteria bacterium]MDE2494478.1 gamma carbonic anhydrase family protein [Alphaproteobacteria bacterium]